MEHITTLAKKKIYSCKQDWQSNTVHEGATDKLMALDLRLIAAVNRSLDATIASLGPAFKQELVLYESLLADSTVACADKAIFPYSDTGKKQYEKSRASCYWHDNGCGFPCLDQYWQANANKSNTAA